MQWPAPATGISGVRGTGRGDIEAARQLAHKYMVGSRASSKEAQEDGMDQLVRGSRRLGLQAFRRVRSLEPTFRNAFVVAQLARVAGDEPLRTEVLESMQRAVARKTGQQESSEQARCRRPGRARTAPVR